MAAASEAVVASEAEVSAVASAEVLAAEAVPPADGNPLFLTHKDRHRNSLKIEVLTKLIL